MTSPEQRWSFTLILLGFLSAEACGGKAATTGTHGDGDASRGDGDGDGDIAGDGDGDGDVAGDGDGDGDIAGDGDGDIAGDGDGDAPISTDRRSCATTSDCVLVTAGCCTPCFEPTASDFIAIHEDFVVAHRQDACQPDEGCPDCVGQPNPRIFTVCENNRCEVADLAAHPATACSTDDECVLLPDACCECGAGTGPDQIVAINASMSAEFRASQCAGLGDVSCPECEWSPPENFVPICAQGNCSYADIDFED